MHYFFCQGAANMKAVALENYCRQLQTALRQQHSYAEAIMQRKFFDSFCFYHLHIFSSSCAFSHIVKVGVLCKSELSRFAYHAPPLVELFLHKDSIGLV